MLLSSAMDSLCTVQLQHSWRMFMCLFVALSACKLQELVFGYDGSQPMQFA